MAVVSGDPMKPGPFVVQFSLPDNYSIAPHFHPTDENITVVSGMFSVGMGDKVDEKSMRMLKPGETATMAANMHHYTKTMGKTVVEVSSTGPFQMIYVNPADDPSKKP
jgi:quercetin dioxygenase-like cupin family protein